MKYISYAQVIAYHRETMVEAGQSALFIAPEKLEAAVARPQTSAFGEDAYPSLAEKAGACSRRS